jgi:parallel beta-helix repeat protein
MREEGMPVKPRVHAGLATVISLAAMLALVGSGVVTLSGAEAAAKQPKCGDTITADTTLHKDLVDCPNNGIVIGANGITLDLNGHTIDGDGAPAAGCNPDTEFCDVGVLNDGHDGLTVRHGSVREFAVGLWGLVVRHNRFLGISSSRNDGSGMGFFRGRRSLVRNCSGSGSVRREGGQGLFLVGSHRLRVVRNSFPHNADLGIFIGFGSTHNLIKENQVSRNTNAGLVLEESGRNRVSRNRFVRNHDEILVGPGSGNAISRNRISRGHEGIRIEKGHRNLVAHNVVVHASGHGIRLGINHPFIGGAHNVVRRNVVRDSRVDGFLVMKKDNGSLLKGNVAKGAGDDGFDVESGSAKLTSNRAVRNHDLGIEAVRGVVDGGGNVARHNGDPRQCTNIACS